MGKILQILLLFIFVFITSFSYSRLENPNLVKDGSQLDEVLYLPNSSAVKATSFGFDNFFADIFWFKAISYFGKHYSGDNNYKWLLHMCNLITDLQPQALHVYEFCGLMLSWEIKDSKAAIGIFDKSIKHNPDYWRNYYLAGMTYALFDKDELKTKEYFVNGSKVEGAPEFMKRMAAKKLANLDDPRNALVFLKDMIASSKDPVQRKSLEEHYLKTLNEIKIKKLQALLLAYEEKYAKKPDEISLLEGLLKDDLVDPWGGKYYINKENYEIETTSKKKRILLFNKEEENVNNEVNNTKEKIDESIIN